jgi:hypothetical protein
MSDETIINAPADDSKILSLFAQWMTARRIASAIWQRINSVVGSPDPNHEEDAADDVSAASSARSRTSPPSGRRGSPVKMYLQFDVNDAGWRRHQAALSREGTGGRYILTRFWGNAFYLASLLPSPSRPAPATPRPTALRRNATAGTRLREDTALVAPVVNPFQPSSRTNG